MNTCAAAPVTVAPRAVTRGRLDCGHDVKGEVAVDLHSTDPESTDPRKLCRHDAYGPCPGPAHTLLDEHFQPTPQQYTPQGRLNPDTLNKHAAACDLCLRRLLGCARGRNCDNAWSTLEGAAMIIVDTSAANLFDRRYMRREAREPAQVELLVTLFRSPALDPDKLPDIDSLPRYLRRAAHNKMVTWLECEERQFGLWQGGPVATRNVPLDGHENPSEDPLIRLHMPDTSVNPEALAVASDEVHEEAAKLTQLLNDFAAHLGQQPRRGSDWVALFNYWVRTLLAGTFTQQSAADALTAKDIKISQPTVHRRLQHIKFDLFTVLEKPDNGLSPDWREHAIKLFCSPQAPSEEDAETSPPGEDTPADDLTLDIDSEAGYDHD